jgi:hypothetical protein
MEDSATDIGLPIIDKKPMVNKSDWHYIRKNLIWAAIVNFSIAVALFIQMYYQQQEILKRLDQVEASQKSLYQEILEVYKTK